LNKSMHGTIFLAYSISSFYNFLMKEFQKYDQV